MVQIWLHVHVFTCVHQMMPGVTFEYKGDLIPRNGVLLDEFIDASFKTHPWLAEKDLYWLAAVREVSAEDQWKSRLEYEL